VFEDTSKWWRLNVQTPAFILKMPTCSQWICATLPAADLDGPNSQPRSGRAVPARVQTVLVIPIRIVRAQQSLLVLATQGIRLQMVGPQSISRPKNLRSV
jgi:hypothetical protein